MKNDTKKTQMEMLLVLLQHFGYSSLNRKKKIHWIFWLLVVPAIIKRRRLKKIYQAFTTCAKKMLTDATENKSFVYGQKTAVMQLTAGNNPEQVFEHWLKELVINISAVDIILEERLLFFHLLFLMKKIFPESSADALYGDRGSSSIDFLKKMDLPFLQNMNLKDVQGVMEHCSNTLLKEKERFIFNFSGQKTMPFFECEIYFWFFSAFERASNDELDEFITKFLLPHQYIGLIELLSRLPSYQKRRMEEKK